MNEAVTAQEPAGSGGVRRAGAPQGLTIAFAGFLPVMGIVSLVAAVPSILRHFAGVPHADTLVPLSVTAPGALIALCGPVAGWAADKIGRRKIIVVATFFYGFLGVVPFFLNHLSLIFATRLCLGVVEAVILTVTNTLLGDYFDPAARRRWLTVQGVTGPVLGTSTIALCGALTEHYWNGAFLIYLVAFPIFIAMVLFFYEPAVPQALDIISDEVAPVAFPTRKVVAFSSVTLFTAIIYYVFIVQGGLAFEAIGVTSAKMLGRLIGLASIGVPLGALLFGWLSRRWSIAKLLALTLAAFGLGMIGIGFAPNAYWMTAASFLQQVASGLSVPTLILWVASTMAPQYRGRGMGWWVCCFFLGQFLSPALVSALHFVSGSLLRTFIIMGGVAMAGACVALAIGQRSGNRVEVVGH